MLKKVAVVGAAGLLAAAVLTQTKVGNIAWGWVDRAERHLDSKVKPEEEIRRIKTEVAKLDKDVDRAKGALAEETVEAKYLAKKVEDHRTSVEASRKAVEARRGAFKGDESTVKWDGRTVHISVAKDLLSREIATHKARETELKSLESMLAVRERSRTMAEQHLQALVSQKAELESDVTSLEADIKLAKIEQVESRYQNDGTRMAKVKSDLNELRKRIEIQREKLALSRKVDPKSVENKSVDEIFAELDKAGSELLGRK